MYNKSEIMKRAWEIFKAGQAIEVTILSGMEAVNAKIDGTAHRTFRIYGRIKAEMRKNTFSKALKMAWEEAHRAVKEAKRNNMTELEKLEEALFLLNMKDFHNFEDRTEVSRLKAEIKKLSTENVCVSEVA